MDKYSHYLYIHLLKLLLQYLLACLCKPILYFQTSMKDPSSSSTHHSDNRTKNIRRPTRIKRLPKSHLKPPPQPTNSLPLQNATPDSNQGCQVLDWNAATCKRYALHLLQHLFYFSSYSVGSYSLALQILKELSFEGSGEICMKIAGTVFLMAAKLNETNRTTIQYILEWSSFALTREHIIDMESQILNGFDFSLPAIEGENDERLQGLCRELENEITDGQQEMSK